jgi:polyhydroxyalkanoate synthesis regulator phasin
MAQKRRRRTGNQNNGNSRRRYSGSRYSGNGHNGGDEERAQRVSSITAEAMRATADRVAENTMAAADIMHEQAEQFVDELCQQSDRMARHVENFFGRWVKLVTWRTQMTREAADARGARGRIMLTRGGIST